MPLLPPDLDGSGGSAASGFVGRAGAATSAIQSRQSAEADVYVKDLILPRLVENTPGSDECIAGLSRAQG